MGIATSMKELTQDILSSAGERADNLKELKKETGKLRRGAAVMVKDFSTSRMEASRRMRRQLAQSSAAMKKGVTESRDEARGLIQDFRTSRKNGGTQQRKMLALEKRLLAQNEMKRKQQVGSMLDNFQNSRQESGAQMRNDLAEDKARMKSDVGKAVAEAEALINEYQSSRRKMGNQLKRGLGKDRSSRKAEVSGMQGDFRRVRSSLRAELNEASDAWKGMSSAIHAMKSGSKAVSGTQDRTSADLRDKLLSVIKESADGIALSQAAKALGVAPIVLGKPAKALREKGKIRREGKLYFPGAD